MSGVSSLHTEKSLLVDVVGLDKDSLHSSTVGVLVGISAECNTGLCGQVSLIPVLEGNGGRADNAADGRLMFAWWMIDQ